MASSSSNITSSPDVVATLLGRTMDMALSCHRSQLYDEAVHLYSAVLRLQPEHPDANHNLGAIAVEKGDFIGALPFFQAALQAQSDNFQYWFSLVDALILAHEDGLAADVLEDARRAGMPENTAGELVERLVAQVTSRKPSRLLVTDPPLKLQRQLGRSYQENQWAETIALGEKLAHRFPASNKVLKALVAAHLQLGQVHQVEPHLVQILRNDPRDVDALKNYALLRAQRGELIQAEFLLRQALHWAPHWVDIWVQLGLVLRKQGKVSAIQAYLQALQLNADDPAALLNYAALLMDLNRVQEAEEYIRKLIALHPSYHAKAYNALGIILQNQGRVQEAVATLRKAIHLSPGDIGVFESYLFAINCDATVSGEVAFAAYQEFNQRFAASLQAQWKPYFNQRSTQRRLRVGYVSSNFRHHSTRFFLEPLLAQHNAERVELFAYAEFYERTDETTERYRQYFDHWCETTALSDQELVDRIRADQIDVLIDIQGHTKGNRLIAFAYKPAPVSLHWLDSGYTTGLTAIDYYLTDAATVPPGSEHLFSETPWRLPHTGLVFRPQSDFPAVNDLPALNNGYVTFGTLSRAIRLNSELIATWAQVLQRLPQAKLVINSGNFAAPDVRRLWLERFERLGIDPARIDVGYQTPAWRVLQRIDITLDCFPQNSGTTLFESLYMGLPFITLSGTPSMGTLGSAVVTALGRPEWIAHSKEDYIDKLVALASDLPTLATIRAGLRQEMQGSPLMDEAGFARDVEDAYFSMFQRWIDNQPE